MAHDSSDLSRVVREFVTSPDRAGAIHFADAHPELRDVGIVHWLVDIARQHEHSDPQVADSWIALAQVLCGGNPAAHLLFDELVARMEQLDGGETELAILIAAEDIAEQVSRSPFVLGCHPLLARQGLRLASQIFARLHSILRDPEHLEPSIRALVFAITITPAGDDDNALLRVELADRFHDQFVAFHDCDYLEQAVEALRDAVSLTDPADSERVAGRLGLLSGWLNELHRRKGDRASIAESVAAMRRNHELHSPSHEDYGATLVDLARAVGDMYLVDQDVVTLSEAIALGRRALDELPRSSGVRPTALNNLALVLGDLYRVTGDVDDLREAVSCARKSVDLTPESDPQSPNGLSNLAQWLGELHDVTHDADLLDEAVSTARDAIDLLPSDHPDRLAHLTNLARLLRSQGVFRDDAAALEEARQLLVGVQVGPVERLLAGRLGADLARLAGDVRGALVALDEAESAFGEEMGRLSGDPNGLRELSGRTDGLVADVAACLLLAGEPARAIESIEAKRIWLPSPPPPGPEPPAVEVPTVWIFSSTWETVVMSRALDHPIVVALRHREVRAAVDDAIAANRRGEPVDALGELLELTSKITRQFPAVDELLLVPLGPCALLPFAAGETEDGVPLIRRSAVTLAPSRGWARAARSPRPADASFGVFHPGEPALPLADDQATFRSAFPRGAIFDRPAAADVLERLRTPSDVAHFSCHGAHSRLAPMLSSLQLEDPLTIQAVLDIGQAPWLVNLSACETGVADLSRAEQSISFPTAFMLAGAAHIVATLWSVGTGAATAYNRAFYRELASGARPAIAHQRALVSLMTRSGPPTDGGATSSETDDRSTSVPWWAAFTLHGSPW